MIAVGLLFAERGYPQKSPSLWMSNCGLLSVDQNGKA